MTFCASPVAAALKSKGVSVFVLHRERVPVRSMEEGGAEVDELGDDGACL